MCLCVSESGASANAQLRPKGVARLPYSGAVVVRQLDAVYQSTKLRPKGVARLPYSGAVAVGTSEK